MGRGSEIRGGESDWHMLLRVSVAYVPTSVPFGRQLYLRTSLDAQKKGFSHFRFHPRYVFLSSPPLSLSLSLSLFVLLCHSLSLVCVN